MDRPSTWLRIRRGPDRVIAALALVATSPVLVVLLVLVAVVDRQAPLVRLVRVGRAGRPFDLWKVRTMRSVEGISEAITTRHDARVTPLGRRLRRYRLDELPQLWNVVRGDMALLGPRPETPAFVDLQDPRWRSVLEASPGIAGPTQIVVHAWEAELDDVAVYRAQVLPRKLEVDAWYVEHASFAIDVAVVRSLVAALRQPGSETSIHTTLRRELPETMSAIPSDRG